MKNNCTILLILLYCNINSQDLKDFIVSTKTTKSSKEMILDFNKKNPSDKYPEITTKTAENNFNNSNWKNAIDNYSDLLLKNPNNSEYYYKRGLSFYYLNDFNNSLLDLNKSIELNYNNTIVYLERAKIKNKTNDFLGAIEDINIYLKTNNSSSLAYSERAYSNMKINQLEKSKEDLKKVISINPKEDISKTQAFIYFLEKDYNKAIENFNLILTKNPNDSGMLFNRAVSHFNIGKLNEACTDWKKSKNLGVSNSEKYIKLYCK